MAGNNILDFEKPLLELKDKIEELQSFMDEKGIDLSEEINRLKTRAKNLQREIYANLEPKQILQIARHPERPTTMDYVDYIFDEFLELHGDRRFGDDKALIGGIGTIDNMPFTLLGHQKGKSTKENLERNFGMAHPEGYRKALRLMKQAEKFNRPVIALINTPGAYPGVGAEERGQAEAIAVNLMEMSDLKVPIIVVVTGEGGSGGALGIGLGDKIMMLEYSYYSVSSPEACAAILWKDANKAPEAARALNLTSADLLRLGIIDEIIKEPAGGAHKDPQQAALLLKQAILKTAKQLKQLSVEELLERRYHKFRKMGIYTVTSKTKNLNNVQSNS
ncbi:acetyl-CoA carboxylase carboxyltransferase subunit alpha [Halothermothrix orenii]|uniref:Acetyl-coenzyme A carboxylase carboxyl transferase subunit alpha n=1 Tax=Halothermothrix orenii (strain H 168 / OCM 544 / DSM 9562) TaxID=373903 RepID=B8D1K4_HALOH|nr:acetyl-CoA carboxylase carboxyltransferase subunit alpha [Halothermothrix orenii]ACL69081.1 acetyl-CoA carboxylase, carboxyl transferase, alpha subunit [Halothermothrix orenii H 168]